MTVALADRGPSVAVTWIVPNALPLGVTTPPAVIEAMSGRSLVQLAATVAVLPPE